MTARYLSVAQIAEELGIPLSTAYERVKGMRHILVGKHIRVSRQALDAWLKEQECYSVVTVYGTRESSSTDGGSRKRRTAQTARRRIASTSNGSEKPRILPITPRTRPRSAP